MSEKISQQDKVVEMLREQKYTREEIMDTVGCNSACLASYLTGMRNAAKFSGTPICPIEKVEGDKKIFVLGSYEEFQTARTPKVKAASAAKTPAQRYAEAVKRVEKAEKAVERYAGAEEAEGVLRFKIAELELELAQLLLSQMDAPEDTDLDTEIETEDAEVTDELL